MDNDAINLSQSRVKQALVKPSVALKMLAQHYICYQVAIPR